MEIIKPGINIDFIGKRKIAFFLSVTLVVATICLLIWRQGPNLGIDFTSGILIQIQLGEKHTPDEIRNVLNPDLFKDVTIQEFEIEEGKSRYDYLIRIQETETETSKFKEDLRSDLKSGFGEDVEITRVEMVGPKVGEELKKSALYAIFFAILFIAIYISGRFELKWLMSIVMAAVLLFAVLIVSGFGVSVTWLIIVALLVTIGLCWFLKLKYAMGAILALIHDVTIVIGAFALTDREVSLAIIAALLTIVGYSLNDTIVVFDRIRENLKVKQKNSEAFLDTVNHSLNETLSRTVITSLTTLFVVSVLFFFGGEVLRSFALALIIGIIVGTYSSLFIASPTVVELQLRRTAGK